MANKDVTFPDKKNSASKKQTSHSEMISKKGVKR